MNNWRIRVSGILLVLSILWYTPWMLANMYLEVVWFALPFVAANLLVVVTSLVTLINNWRRTSPPEKLVPPGAEVPVAVLIPTCGEPVHMVAQTIRSVVTQDWPPEQLRIIVGDDGHSPEVAKMVEGMQQEFPAATIIYHEPPRRGEPTRRGDAKSGNLNSQLDLVLERFPEVAFIETRDADDEVCDPLFLRHCVGQLGVDEKIAFVQTVKETRVSEGDPFCNNETLFYRGAMLARNASNAVFPCGSGLLWRLVALQDIGGFPTWNLVEDLHSGIEALRRGWRGVYLPIVGVLSQHAPEDIPNVYKQRGVWALDTIRLLIWGKIWKGLNLRQRLHFLELGLFYSLSYAMLIFMLVPIMSLSFNIHALKTDNFSYIIHFWPFAGAIELFLTALNDKHRYELLWRSREMWVGLSIVYAKACWLGLKCGPKRKPVYKVTRKVHNFGWYWRETLVQAVLVVLLGASVLYALAISPALYDLDLGTIFWALFLITVLGSFVRKSWFGLDWRNYIKVLVSDKLLKPVARPTLKLWNEFTNSLTTLSARKGQGKMIDTMRWEANSSEHLRIQLEEDAPQLMGDYRC